MNQDKNTVVKKYIKSPQGNTDLIDILMQLRRGKLTIVAFALLGMIISVIYLSVVKEKWTSETIITFPDAGQIANYHNAMGVLYSHSPSTVPTVTNVEQLFFGRFGSALSALSEQLNNQEKPEKISISPAFRDQSVPVKVSYTSNTAADAQKKLTAYIQQINKRVVLELDDDLKTSVSSKIADIKESLASQEKIAQEKKNARLEILNQALLVAEQSKIKNTLVQQAERLSEDTLFVLGSDALSSMIKNEATRPLPLDESYFNARQRLLAMISLKSVPEATYSFRYVMKPILPLHKDSPKKGLTLVLGTMIGLISGAGVALGRRAIRSYKLTV